METKLDDLTGSEWLEMMFEFNYCEECGRDTPDHKAVPFMGHWFAYCLKEPQVQESSHR